MRNRSSLDRVAALCVTIVGLVLLIVTKTTGAGVPRADNYSRGVQIVKAAFPELSSGGFGVILGSSVWRTLAAPIEDLQSFVLVVRSTDSQDHSELTREQQPAVLRANVEFSETGELQSYIGVVGTVVHQTENGILYSYFQDHQSATTDELAAELRRVGARFGPGTESEVRQIGEEIVRRLRPVLGDLVVQSVQWEQVNGVRWVVAISTRADGPLVYYAHFEVIGGKLVMLYRPKP